LDHPQSQKPYLVRSRGGQGQQQGQPQMQQQVVGTGGGPNIADSIKKEAKSIMVIIFLSILFNLGQVDSVFKKVSMFVEEGGSLNMQCVFVKALLIGSLFFAIKSQLL